MLLLVFFLHLFLFAYTNEWVRTDHDAVMVYISGHHMLSISAMYSKTISTLNMITESFRYDFEQMHIHWIPSELEQGAYYCH